MEYREYRNEQGQPHRTDGPAVMFANGTQVWYSNGKLHRRDGPAVIRATGTQEWYLHGQELTQFEHWLLAGAKEIA